MKKVLFITMPAMFATLVFTGCASITESKLQPVSVQTLQDGKEVSGALCVLVNDTGKWFTTTPGSVTIHKSTDDLTVDCNKDNNEYSGHETVVSKSTGMLWGNILAGGGIGYVVDRNTGAGFDYPTGIVVTLHRVGKNLGLTGPETKPAATNSNPTTTTADQSTASK
jgi:hypothetical protein